MYGIKALRGLRAKLQERDIEGTGLITAKQLREVLKPRSSSKAQSPSPQNQKKLDDW
jgi:hypothetical protein